LAILPSLLAEVDGETYAIPLESVVEVVRVERRHLGVACGSPAVRIRGRIIAVKHLEPLLRDCLRQPVASAPEKRVGVPPVGEARTLVIVRTGEREIGIPVDALRGEQEVVIKSLAENYLHVPGVSGAGILGDGRVSLILDPTALIEAACRGGVGRSI
jgi:two-component system chemotaxis sensor kinase CheA